MNYLKFKTYILIAAVFFILGFVCTFLLMDQCDSSNSSTGKILPVKEMKKQMDLKITVYRSRILELQKWNRQLQQKLTGTEAELFAAKSKVKEKETSIKKLIRPKGFPVNELLKKVNRPVAEIDSNLSPCDSLVREVSEYMEDNSIKDRLYETKISLQDSVIAVKDSVISTQANLYEVIKTSFNVSVEQQQNLSAENARLKKRFKRQKFKSKLINIGTMVLSGLAVGYLFNH